MGFRYRLRAKRHGDDGTVSTYPTPGAVEFLFQPPAQEALSGLEEIRLIVGYTWDRETRTMGQAVLSLRDGQDEIVWLVDLPDPGTGYAGGTVIPLLPPADGPSSPVIQLGDEETDRDHKDMEEGTRS
ncbi:MAG: hypothetical protein IRY84_15085 [Thermobispora bispora]|nr:hypothetical protein [Thermobispora bispora]